MKYLENHAGKMNASAFSRAIEKRSSKEQTNLKKLRLEK